MAKTIQAALSGVAPLADRTYFFGQRSYRRYDWGNDVLDDQGSLPNWLWHLPLELFDGFDTALNGWGSFAGHAYFFKGDQYVRYNWNKNRVDLGPVSIASSWQLAGGFASGLDAAVNGYGTFAGKAYFFKDDEYARYDWATGQVDLVASMAAWNLPQEFLSGIDAATNGLGAYEGKLYLFKDDKYVRYDWASGTVDPGYPKTVSSGWPALTGMTEPARRRVILFVTIDPGDHHTAGDAGAHEPNVQGLKRIAGAWRSTAVVDDLWGPQLNRTILEDPHLLALFLSGSFTEWVEVYRQPSWSAMLDALCSLIKTTEVPILAACGSHQLVAQAYGGWGAVAHMSDGGTPPVTIDAESDGVFRAPNPRIGEVGVFPACSPSAGLFAADPLLNSIPSQMFFVEYHHDQVLASGLSGIAAPLLLPNGVYGAIQGGFDLGLAVVSPGQAPVGYMHRPILIPDERCQTQALRYNVNPVGRILYTTQFHPELTWGSTDASAAQALQDSSVFLTNFFEIADQYWINLPT